MINQERLKMLHDRVAQLHDDLVEQRIEDAKKGLVSTRYIALERETEPEEIPEIINICGTLLHHITCLREMELAIGPALPIELDSYRGKAPFVSGSDTSKKAADQTAPFRMSLSAQVFAAIKVSGNQGATDDEIETRLDMRHQTVSPRRRELVLSGAIRDSGERRKTRSGRTATVWKWIKPHPWKQEHNYPSRKGKASHV